MENQEIYSPEFVEMGFDWNTDERFKVLDSETAIKLFEEDLISAN